MNPVNLSNDTLTNFEGIWQTSEKEQISYTKNGHQLIKNVEEDSFWFQHRLECLSILVDKFRLDRVLDVGGGNGAFTNLLQSKNLDATLIEPGQEGVINAKKSGVKDIMYGSLSSAKIKSRSVGAVVALDVVEHVEHDVLFLQEIHRITETDGYLIMTVPAYSFLYSSFDKTVGHFRRYTTTDLKNKLTASGFKVLTSSYFFSWLILPVLLTRFLLYPFIQKEKRSAKGHISKNSFLGKLMMGLLSVEKFFIRRGIRIPFGTSVFAVAQKIH